MTLNNFEDLYVQELRDLYSAEQQLTKALPKMAKAAESATLRQAFTSHLEETKEHVERLKTIFDKLGKKPGGHKCEAMEGLISEGEDLIEKEDKGPLKDAGLIAAAQRVEHYEIAAYGTARTFAEITGDSSAASLLDKTLEEEKSADKKLNNIATREVNELAARENQNNHQQKRRGNHANRE